MAIISKVGRNSAKGRLLILSIYLLLTAGAITMIYPFALMAAGSTKSGADESDAVLIPRFLYNDEALWAKHFEGLANESLELAREAQGNETMSFADLKPPTRLNERLVEQWLTFLKEAKLPHYTYSIGYIHVPRSSRGVVPHALRDFKRALSARFGGDIHQLNQTFGTEFLDWFNFQVPPENHLLRGLNGEPTQLILAMREFKARQPEENRYYFSLDAFFRTFVENRHGRDIDHFNATHQTRYNDFREIRLGQNLAELRGSKAQRVDWEQFVRGVLNPVWVGADARATPQFQNFLQARYGQIQHFNGRYGTNYANFEAVALPHPEIDDRETYIDWPDFVAGWTSSDGEFHQLPVEFIQIHGVEHRFRDWLRQRYGSIDRLNEMLNEHYDEWQSVEPPQFEAHYLRFQPKRASLRWEFLTRNYATVIDYLVLHGNGLMNTAVYCALAVLLALLINPLAAYALSRYRPPSTYRILLIMMLTMSFPPMVTQIPVFLMLRELGLLNTFWALVLPGLASGYWIFMLKGFFDSLPRELYESAQIDGAGELRIFWQITMSLSKPVLAVIALSAFAAAYSNFMFALLICQDQKMWTLMVWLYQLQQRSGPGVIYASLMVAAVPTFLIFAFCQSIIMRGIVVPVQK